MFIFTFIRNNVTFVSSYSMSVCFLLPCFKPLIQTATFFGPFWILYAHWRGTNWSGVLVREVYGKFQHLLAKEWRSLAVVVRLAEVVSLAVVVFGLDKGCALSMDLAVEGCRCVEFWFWWWCKLSTLRGLLL